MAWVVDTCLLLDVGLDDPSFGKRSESLLQEKAEAGLLVCPVTFVELAPAFAGDLSALRQFLLGIPVGFEEGWQESDTETAARAWARHIGRKREGRESRRPVADVLIGAFSTRFEGILTRNGDDFHRFFPKLKVLSPKRQ